MPVGLTPVPTPARGSDAVSDAGAGRTARPDEIARFNRLASTWWDPTGPMRPLHVTNTLRTGWVLDRIAAHWGRPRGDLGGLRVADIGCGGGLMCEPLAALGARVTGVDAAARNIEVARLHAGLRELAIDYRIGEPGTALRSDDRFDLMLLLEVVEHVDDVGRFVATAAQHLEPGGLLLASTINRTAWSWVVAIAGAEYALRLLPRGTHRWRQFVRPEELAAHGAACGLTLDTVVGMRYLPFVHRASWTRDTRVNYLAAFSRPPSA